jgi:hypothetical protein
MAEERTIHHDFCVRVGLSGAQETTALPADDDGILLF